MKRRTPFNSVRLFLAILLGLLVTGPAAAQKGKGGGGSTPAVYYRVTPVLLNSPGYVSDLNSSSAAVGYIRAPEERIAFVWTKETAIIPLQSLLSVSDQQWHLEVLEGINDFGQIVGFASIQGGDPNRPWSAFRLDWPNGWLTDGATLTILEEGLQYQPDLQISNAGDIVMSVYSGAGDLYYSYYYPANFPATASTSLGPPLYVVDMNAFGEIIGGRDGSSVRLRLNSEGGYSETVFPIEKKLVLINDAGTILGLHKTLSGKYSSFPYLFRYTDQQGEVVLKDGTRTITDFRSPRPRINQHGDVAVNGYIHTAEGKYLDVNSLIHPDDAAGYLGSNDMRGIASRNETGLPPVMVALQTGSTGGSPSWLLYDTYLLTPTPSGN